MIEIIKIYRNWLTELTKLSINLTLPRNFDFDFIHLKVREKKTDHSKIIEYLQDICKSFDRTSCEPARIDTTTLFIAE